MLLTYVWFKNGIQQHADLPHFDLVKAFAAFLKGGPPVGEIEENETAAIIDLTQVRAVFTIDNRPEIGSKFVLSEHFNVLYTVTFKSPGKFDKERDQTKQMPLTDDKRELLKAFKTHLGNPSSTSFVGDVQGARAAFAIDFREVAEISAGPIPRGH